MSYRTLELDQLDDEQLAQLVDQIGEDYEDAGPFIHENDMVEYAMEFADDIGAVPTEYTWPTSCIDWKQAAWELSMDYTGVEVDGVTWMCRP